MRKAPRSIVRVTPTILGWAVADVIGVLMLAAGAAYLVHGPGFFGLGFPTSTMEAAVTAILGLGLVFVAAVKMLAEVLSQLPRESAKPNRD